jgi:hypothetical protein
MRACLALSLSLALACGSSSSTDPATEPVEPVEPAPVHDEPAPIEPVDACGDLIAEYASILDASSGTCATDADCGCYQGGVGPRAGCGGVTDRTSTTRLDALLERYRNAGCNYTQLCGPWACNPRCNAGRCENAR